MTPEHRKELTTTALAKMEEALEVMNQSIIPVHCIDCIYYRSEDSTVVQDAFVVWCDEDIWHTLPGYRIPDEHTFYCAYGKKKGESRNG